MLIAFGFPFFVLIGARNELEKLEDVNNQILLKLHEHSRHAHAAVLWLRNNKEQFRGKIHEPIMTVVRLCVVILGYDWIKIYLFRNTVAV